MFNEVIKPFLCTLVLSFTLLTTPVLATNSDPVELEHVTIADLEVVLNRAPSLQEFLNSAELQRSYFEVAQRYYGGSEKFSEKSYYAILESFKKSLMAIPELADRAWRVRPMRQPIVIQSAIKAYGVIPNIEKWREFLLSLGFELGDTQSLVSVSDIEEKLQAIEAEIKTIEASVPQRLSPRRRQEHIGDRYKALKDSEVVFGARRLILQHLSGVAFVKNNLTSSHGDVALETIDRIRNRTGQILPELAQYSQALRLAMNSIPQAGTLAIDRDLFLVDESFRKAYDFEFQFIDLPRRFHALFRGIPHAECVGGDKEYLNLLTPRRYLIPLLDGGHEIHVLKDSNYIGYISTIAVASGEKHFLSLDLMVGELSKNTYVARLDKEAVYNRRSIFSQWFIKESQRTKNNHMGYVVGQSDEINNAHGLESIRTSGPWIEGTDAGYSTDYRTLDPLEAQIVSLPRPERINPKYDVGRMVYDLSVVNALRAIRLSPVDFDNAVFDESNWLQKRFEADYFTEALTWAAYFYITPTDVQADTALYTEAWLILSAINDKKHVLHEHALKFLEYCGQACMEGIFRSAFSNPLTDLKMFINRIIWFQVMPSNRRFDLLKNYLNRSLGEGIRLALREADPVDALCKLKKDVPMNIVDCVHVTRSAILSARTARDFLKSVATYLKQPTAQYLEETDKIILEHLQLFFSLKPSVNELTELVNSVHAVSTRNVILEQALLQTKTVADFMGFVQAYSKSESDEIKTYVQGLLVRYVGHFVSLQPSIKNILELANYTISTEQHIAVLRAGMSVVSRPDDYIELVGIYLNNPSQVMVKGMIALIQETIAIFQNTRPWPSDWVHLRNRYPKAKFTTSKASIAQKCSELLSRTIP